MDYMEIGVAMRIDSLRRTILLFLQSVVLAAPMVMNPQLWEPTFQILDAPRWVRWDCKRKPTDLKI
jgi:hypothetical protein